MNKSAILLLMVLFFTLPLSAAEMAFQFEKGNAQGTRDYQTTDSVMTRLNDSWDADLTGDASAFMLSYAQDNGLMYGLGQHSYKLSGESTDHIAGTVGTISYTVDSTLKVTNYQTSGLFAMLGYQWNLTDNLRLQPQLRIGINNKVVIDETLDKTLSLTGQATQSASASGSTSGDANIRVLTLPINYKMGEFFIGAQYQSIGSVVEAQGTNEVATYRIESAILAQVGVLF